MHGRYDLQKLMNICTIYGPDWDTYFNMEKNHLITFGGCNPRGATLYLHTSATTATLLKLVKIFL